MAFNPAAAFGTVLTAMVTPLTADGDLDLESATALAHHLLATGHDGIVVNGTTGESPTTSNDEKAQLVSTVKRAVGEGAKVVAGAGTNDTRHAIELAKAAADAGADALLVVSPYYSRPTQSGLIAHFESVAGATELPVMLYDIPGRCGVAIGDEVIDAFAGHPTICALKDATGNVPQAYARMARSQFGWYSGDDSLNLAFLAGGATGVVSVAGHVTGRDMRAMVDAATAGDLPAALAAERCTQPIVRAICGGGQGAAMAKAAAQAIGVIASRATRLPILPATDEQYHSLRTDLTHHGYKETAQ